MSAQACCSHGKISRHREDYPSGPSSEYWKCDTCETRFYAEAVNQTANNRRDYFAAAALPVAASTVSALSDPEAAEYAKESGLTVPLKREDFIAKLAYRMSDALMKVRDTQP